MTLLLGLIETKLVSFGTCLGFGAFFAVFYFVYVATVAVFLALTLFVSGAGVSASYLFVSSLDELSLDELSLDDCS